MLTFWKINILLLRVFFQIFIGKENSITGKNVHVKAQIVTKFDVTKSRLNCNLFFLELPTILFFSCENSTTYIMLRSRLALAKITKSLAADFSFRKETRIAWGKKGGDYPRNQSREGLDLLRINAIWNWKKGF